MRRRMFRVTMFAAAATLLSAAGLAFAGDAGSGSGAMPFYRNAALPHPDDLVSFDDRPARPDPNQIVELDELGAGQAAFPLYYGAVPVTPGSGQYNNVPLPPPSVPPPSPAAFDPTPEAPAPRRSASAAPPAVIMSAPTAAVPPPAMPPPQPAYAPPPVAYAERNEEDLGTAQFLDYPTISAPPLSSVSGAVIGDEGFIDYQEYLRKTQDQTPPQTPQPETAQASAPGDGALTPVPATSALATAATQAATSGNGYGEAGTPVATVSLDELRAPPPEAVPLPPPPLPELPGNYTLKADLDAVYKEFDRLRAFCETDDLAGATSVYAAMPNFGDDEEINRIRADSANLLILGLSRTGNLSAARQVYDSLPSRMPGFDANLARARSIINLTTYYVRAERFNDAYTVLMDIGGIQNRSALNNELFRLMARMIPYLDNAEETGKAMDIYDLLLKEVKSPGTAALFAENMRAVIKYHLHFVDNTESPTRRRKRLDFLEHVFDSLEILSNGDVLMLRKDLGASLAERYAGTPEKAARFVTTEG